MIYNQIGANGSIVNFVEKVFEQSGTTYEEVIIKDYDLDRIYLLVDGKTYCIRTWDINEKGIRYSLFKELKNYGEELYHSFISRDAFIL